MMKLRSKMNIVKGEEVTTTTTTTTTMMSSSAVMVRPRRLRPRRGIEIATATNAAAKVSSSPDDATRTATTTITNSNNKRPLETSIILDTAPEECWDIIEGPLPPDTDKTCMGRGCTDRAVAAWADTTDDDPKNTCNALWYSCLACQKNDFDVGEDGWPADFDPRGVRFLDDNDDDDTAQDHIHRCVARGILKHGQGNWKTIWSDDSLGLGHLPSSDFVRSRAKHSKVAELVKMMRRKAKKEEAHHAADPIQQRLARAVLKHGFGNWKAMRGDKTLRLGHLPSSRAVRDRARVSVVTELVEEMKKRGYPETEGQEQKKNQLDDDAHAKDGEELLDNSEQTTCTEDRTTTDQEQKNHLDDASVKQDGEEHEAGEQTEYTTDEAKDHTSADSIRQSIARGILKHGPGKYKEMLNDESLNLGHLLSSKSVGRRAEHREVGRLVVEMIAQERAEREQGLNLMSKPPQRSGPSKQVPPRESTRESQVVATGITRADVPTKMTLPGSPDDVFSGCEIADLCADLHAHASDELPHELSPQDIIHHEEKEAETENDDATGAFLPNVISHEPAPSEEEEFVEPSSSQQPQQILARDIISALLQKESSSAYSGHYDRTMPRSATSGTSGSTSTPTSKPPKTRECYVAVQGGRDEISKYLFEVVHTFQESIEFVEVAMNYLDRYLLAVEKEHKTCMHGSMSIYVHAFACLGLAMKIFSSSGGVPRSLSRDGIATTFHPNDPNLPDNVYTYPHLIKAANGKFDLKDVEAAELDIMKKLDHFLSPPTAYAFVEQFLKLAPKQPQQNGAAGDDDLQLHGPLHDVSRMAFTQLEHHLMELPQEYTYRPSVIARTVVLNAILFVFHEETTTSQPNATSKQTQSLLHTLKADVEASKTDGDDDYWYFRAILCYWLWQSRYPDVYLLECDDGEDATANHNKIEAANDKEDDELQEIAKMAAVDAEESHPGPPNMTTDIDETAARSSLVSPHSVAHDIDLFKAGGDEDGGIDMMVGTDHYMYCPDYRGSIYEYDADVPLLEELPFLELNSSGETESFSLSPRKKPRLAF